MINRYSLCAYITLWWKDLDLIFELDPAKRGAPC